MLVLGVMAVAGAAPVLTEPTQTPLERCVQAAQAEIDVELPPAPELRAGAGLDKIALVVGVPCHDRPEVPSLAFSSRDAARMGAQLAHTGYHVVSLTHVVDRSTFLDTLDRAAEALDPDGELLVYFSGHGMLATENGQVRRFLVFSDTDLGAVTRTGLPGLLLDERISRVSARSRVLIQDTCFAATKGGKSLGMSSGQGRPKGVPVPVPSLQLQAGDVRLYAAQYFEQAIESPDHRASLYTHHLLTALHDPSADLDGNGCVDLREGHSWARDRTVVDRAGHQTPQSVFLQSAAPLLGCTPHTPSRGVIVLPDGHDWTIEVHDARGELVRRDGGAVPAGTYRVEVGRVEPRPSGLLAHRSLLDARVRVEAGEWLDLDLVVASRRTPLTEVTLDFIARTPNDLPATGGGVTVIRSAAETAIGRPTLGARVYYAAGIMPSSFAGSSPSPDTLARSVELQALIGDTWTVGRTQARLAWGPLLGAGLAVVSRCSRPPCSGGRTAVTTLASAGVRARWLMSPSLSVALELGLQGHLLQTEDPGVGPQFEPVFAPTLQVGVGPRL